MNIYLPQVIAFDSNGIFTPFSEVVRDTLKVMLAEIDEPLGKYLLMICAE